MKNENVVKINKLGKVSRILIVIIMVVTMITMVCLPIVMAFMLIIPNDGVKINGEASVNIIVDRENVPDNVFKIEESDFNSKIFGTALKWIVKDKGVVNGEHLVTIEGGVKNLTGKQLKSIVIVACIGGEIILISLYIALIFAKRLAKALETCRSPFEDEVLKRMKPFGIAFAVWGGAVLVINGISGLLAVFAVIIVLLFISIFKYGAQLQQQSDDTV